MSHNTFGHLFRVTTWGESHGPAIGCVVDGCPPRIPISEDEINHWMEKRRPGQSRFTTQRREPDTVRILSGVFEDEASGELREVLDEPLADELTRGQALRLGALLHDIGKPATYHVREDGRVTFMGHDRLGQEMVREICRRLRMSVRLCRFLEAVTRHHLVLGFVVHERPLDRRDVYRYLERTSPVEVEVTLLSVADRLATRGKNAERAIDAHLQLAKELMPGVGIQVPPNLSERSIRRSFKREICSNSCLSSASSMKIKWKLPSPACPAIGAMRPDASMSFCVSTTHSASREIGTHTSVASASRPGQTALTAQ